MRLIQICLLILLSQCRNKGDHTTSVASSRTDTPEAVKSFYATADSIKKGLRKNLYKDTAGNIIPDSVADEMILSGEYETFLAIFDVIIYPRSKDKQLEYSAIKPPPSEFFVTGAQFPSFLLKDINGGILNSKKMRGKILVFNYWFINCLPCKREIPQLNKLVEEYRSNSNIVFIGIALDKKKDLQMFLKTEPFEYHIIPDGNKLIGNENISFFPTHVVVNAQGKIIFHCSESGDRVINWLKKSIDSCLVTQAKSNKN